MKSKVKAALTVFGGAAMLAMTVGFGSDNGVSLSDTTIPITAFPSPNLTPLPLPSSALERPIGGGKNRCACRLH